MRFDCKEEILEKELSNAYIVYAVYETGDYDGSWRVVYIKDNKWFEDSGSHCSCDGPEWGPVEVKPHDLLIPDEYFDDNDFFIQCVNKALANNQT